jgi:hypothetical protein
MMNVSLAPDARTRMNVEEFLAWSERQPAEDRYELVDGAMQSLGGWSWCGD